MLSARTIEIVKATAPVVATHAEAITRRFYSLMFAAHPELFAYFNHAHQQSGRQQRALADAVIAYATHIENIPILLPAVELIAQKHCSLGIQPAHYPIVGQYLLAAIRDVLGEAATEEIIAAWAEAYGVLAEIFITREAEIYRQQASQPGGWNGYRRFVVTKKAPECETVTSFHLQPADGRPLAGFLPGQYITIKINPAKFHQPTTTGGSAPLIAPRNYSLSDRPGQEHYRISVKRETSLDGQASLNGQSFDGVVSNHLHDCVNVGDILEVGPPCGEFILDPAVAATRPLVFIAGGVGVTPLLSMLKSVLHHGPQQPIHFVQAATNRPRHAFHQELATLAHSCPLLTTHVRYSQPLAADRLAARHHSEGTIDQAFLDSLIAKSPPGAEFYFCGPAPFMQAIAQRLQNHQIEDTRIHFEFFGPKLQLTAA